MMSNNNRFFLIIGLILFFAYSSIPRISASLNNNFFGKDLFQTILNGEPDTLIDSLVSEGKLDTLTCGMSRLLAGYALSSGNIITTDRIIENYWKSCEYRSRMQLLQTINYVYQGKTDDAIRIWDHFTSSSMFLTKCTHLLREREYEKAINSCEIYRKIEPNDIRGYIQLGQVYLSINEFESALSVFLEGVQIDDRNIDALYGLAQSFYETERYEDAENIYKDVVFLDPSNSYHWLGLGLSQYRQAKYEEAITSFQKSIQLDSSRPAAYAYLGRTLYLSGKTEDSVSYLNMSVILDPNRFSYKVWLGDAYYKLGKKKEALDQYRAAIQIISDNVDLKEKINIIESELENNP